METNILNIKDRECIILFFENNNIREILMYTINCGIKKYFYLKLITGGKNAKVLQN